MTDQYYVHEDQVETPETQLANLQAHSSATSAVIIWSDETLNQVRGIIEPLWLELDAQRQAAELRGNVEEVNRLIEQQNKQAEVYKLVEHMRNTLHQTTAAMGSVLETAHALAKQKHEKEEELGSLLEAIDKGNYDDERLKDLAEMMETDIYEMISYNGGFDPANKDVPDEDSSDYDNIVADVYKHVRTLVPNLTHSNAEHFFASLIGDYALNDIQRGLLISLIRTFEVQAAAS